MGFSLKMFLEDLEEILKDKDVDKDVLLALALKEVLGARKYAKECGQLS